MGSRFLSPVVVCCFLLSSLGACGEDDFEGGAGNASFEGGLGDGGALDSDAADEPSDAATGDASDGDGVTPAMPEDFLGDWGGALPVLTLIFHIEEVDGGGLSASMDSVDQGRYGIPGSNVRIEGDRFLTAFPLFGADLDVRRDGDALVGFFNLGSAFSITLTQVEIVPASRPQEEALLRDYEIQEVEFAGGEDGVMLAGELTMPSDGGPFPGVVLISGTGAQNRDEEVYEHHKPFLILSDHLTQNGFVVLRYDDRGFGESSGDFATATTEDFAADAAAALAFLRAQSGVDPARAGYVGHSEGVLVAPMATQVEQAQFMVLLAGPTQKPVDSALRQARDIGAADGLSEGQLQVQEMMLQLLYQAVREAESPEAAREAALQVLISAGAPPARAEAEAARLASPWFMWLMDYDPVPALEAFAGPVLALYGEKDLQANPDANAPAMEAALSDPASSVQTLTGLNHLFQPAETGLPSEYRDIETTFDPGALMIISDWLTDVATP